MKKYRVIYWRIFRAFCVLFFSYFLAVALSDNLNFELEFHPLYKENKVFVPLINEQRYELLKNVFKFDVLRYNLLFSNNSSVVMGGDKNDHEHDVDVFVKFNNSQEEELQIKRGEEKVILSEKRRNQVLEDIRKIEYRNNINLKAEALIDNKVIEIGKDLKGSAKIKSELTFNSKIVLLIFSFLLVVGIIKLTKEVYQFIVYGKNYFK